MGDTNQIRPTNLLVSGTPYVDIRAMSPTVDISDGSVSAVAALNAAAAIGSPVLIPPGTYLIDSSVSCTASIVMSGGKFSVTTGTTLTIVGAFACEPVQAFDGAGAVAFGGGTTKNALPQWWGAKGDGVQDDAPAMRKAFESGAGIRIPRGEYLMDSIGAYDWNGNSWVLRPSSNQSIVGEIGAKIKFGDGMIDEGDELYGTGLILILDRERVDIRNVLIDMNGENNLVGSGKTRNCIAVKITDSSEITIVENTIADDPGHNGIVAAQTSSLVRIERNTIINGGTSIEGNVNQNDWSAIYSEADDSVISGNCITHDTVPQKAAGGIEVHGSGVVCDGNFIKNAYPGIYIGGFSSTHLSDIVVSNNVMKACLSGVIFSGNDIRRCSVKGNVIELNRTGFGAYASVAPCIGVRSHYDGSNAYTSYFGSLIDCEICDNVIVQTDTHTESQAGGGMILAAMDGVRISGNIIRNVASTGIILRGTPWETRNVSITDNLIHDFGMNTSPYAKYGIQLSFAMTFTAPAENPSGLANLVSNVRGLYINGNVFSKTTSGTDNAFWVAWNASSVIEGLVIGQNKYFNIGGNKATGDQAGSLVIGETNIGAVGSKISGFRFAKTSSLIPDGGTIAHGMGSTLSAAFCMPSVAGEMAAVTGISATNITVAIKKHDNSAGTAQYIYWLGLL